jgi:hypothetical protein
MDIVLFTGPTLPPELVTETLGARCLPPVSQGDVYRAALDEPEVIGIIDGYFRSMPSVWHKEILWALSLGIKVYGSASMGALRAAELEPFGMIGVGQVYEAFKNGTLIDDDEVAVEHGPAELGYACTSEAMVNIRSTLSAAERGGIISTETRQMLEVQAKGLFYPMRTYANILANISSHVDRTEIAVLSKWLPSGKINQKREDALSMLEEIRRSAANAPRVNFVFERTEMWEEAIREPVRAGNRT